MTLRINISDERDGMVFTLIGRIQAEQVSELQALLKSAFPDHKRVLDLQATAVESAQRSLDLSNTRYEGGVTSYLEVITAQNAALSDEVTAVNILGRRMASAVLLIEALGGGWDRSTLARHPECCGKLAMNGN